jgi:hypothetical protein
MKKLFALLFAGALAISLAMPVFAQDQGAAPSSDQTQTSTGKKPKEKKAKKEKKPKSTDSGTAAPQQ